MSASTAARKPRAQSPMSRARPTEQPYAVFRRGLWEWRVLKSYQADDSKQYARWLTAVRSEYTYGSFEVGDTYVHDVVTYGRLVDWDRDALGEGYGDALRALSGTAREPAFP